MERGSHLARFSGLVSLAADGVVNRLGDPPIGLYRVVGGARYLVRRVSQEPQPLLGLARGGDAFVERRIDRLDPLRGALDGDEITTAAVESARPPSAVASSLVG